MRHLEGEEVHPHGTRWGDVMADDLGDGFEIITEGLPGRTTVFDDPVEGAFRNGLTALPAILHSHVPIDLLIICLGTNDQKARFGLHAIDIATGMRRLVREARATAAIDKVLLIVPPTLMEVGDFAQMFSGAVKRAQGLAAFATRFAAEEHAEVVDAGEVISVDPADGIHWSAEAHEKLGRHMAPIVKGLL